MDNLSGCKVVHIDSRRRIALQCVDLLLPGATPRQRKRIANRILAICGGKGRVHSRRECKPRRLTPELLDDLLRIHASCVHDQQGKCGLLISISSLTSEINQGCGLADDTDKGFKRHDPMCAARPLRTPFVEKGCRLVDSMFEEDTDGKDRG
jgi:hypothetical protein